MEISRTFDAQTFPKYHLSTIWRPYSYDPGQELQIATIDII